MTVQMPQTVQRFERRFFARFKVNPESNCWEWQGSLSEDGYGCIFYVDRNIKAHRASWLIHHGSLPPSGMAVCHHCDNPKCVNPEHLFVGSWRDNTQDAIRKGRRGNWRKPSCSQGHDYTPENTKLNKYGHRRCKTCVKVWERRAELKRRSSYA